MANTFKNKLTTLIDTSPVTVYTTPSATTSTVIGVNVANVITSNISVSVQIVDDSTSTTAYLVKDALIIPGSSAVLVGGDQKVVLEPNDTIQVTSSALNSADVVVSVLEIS
jgi:hypothetical protein